jgi:hypothetical protein
MAAQHQVKVPCELRIEATKWSRIAFGRPKPAGTAWNEMPWWCTKPPSNEQVGKFATFHFRNEADAILFALRWK